MAFPPSSSSVSLLVFVIEGRRWALPARVVHRVVSAVAITPLPGGHPSVLGLIVVKGEAMPVINLRRRLGYPERDLETTDHFILAEACGQRVALVADRVEGLAEIQPGSLTAAEDLAPSEGFIEGVVYLRVGLALLQDLDRFLSPKEREALQAALAEA